MTGPDISLVVGTIGRRSDLARLLDSLLLQSGARFEVLIADQNPPEFLDALLMRYERSLDVKRLCCSRGLSRARNVGLRAAAGMIVGFPDDDCWFDAGVLASVLAHFAADPCLGGITGVCRDESGIVSAGRYDNVPGEITRNNVWRRGNSASLFVRRSLAERLKGFDETLGVGAPTPWQSGEETDFLLRAIERGYRLRFDPSFVVRHPQVSVCLANTRTRGLPYGRGYMKVLQKHQYSFLFKLRAVLKPLAGSVVRAVLGRYSTALLSFWTAVGRLDAMVRDNPKNAHRWP